MRKADSQFKPTFTHRPVGGGNVQYGYLDKNQNWVDVGSPIDLSIKSPDTMRQIQEQFQWESITGEKIKKEINHQYTLRENKPKDNLLLDQAIRKANDMDAWINKAKGLADKWWAIGEPGMLAGVMPWTTPSSQLEDYLMTIKANLDFDKLQEMREASKTDGALDQAIEMENRLLQAVNGALNRKNPKILKQNLEIIHELYPQVLREKADLFKATYGGEFQIPERKKNG